MLDLLGKGADAFEFSARRSKVVLVLRHGVGGRNKVFFQILNRAIQHLGNAATFFFLLLFLVLLRCNQRA